VGGVVGDMVFIPGSPAMSLPELLQEAEVGLERQESAVAQTLRSVPVPLPASPTPSPGARCSPVKESEPSKDRTPVPSDTDQREWTRDHWKQLDACFTDERIEVGTRLGLGSDVLANVDEVEIENVVTRFLSIAGGPDIADPSSRPRWAK
jgi:hypothetical protein